MIEDPNFGFVVAAYAIGLLVLGGATAMILWDYLSLKRALARLSAAALGEAGKRQGDHRARERARSERESERRESLE